MDPNQQKITIKNNNNRDIFCQGGRYENKPMGRHRLLKEKSERTRGHVERERDTPESKLTDVRVYKRYKDWLRCFFLLADREEN